MVSILKASRAAAREGHCNHDSELVKAVECWSVSTTARRIHCHMSILLLKHMEFTNPTTGSPVTCRKVSFPPPPAEDFTELRWGVRSFESLRTGSGFVSANDRPRVGAIGAGSRWCQKATDLDSPWGSAPAFRQCCDYVSD